MEVSFTRGDELGREQRTLSAGFYNQIRLMFSRCQDSCLFIPIRSMQYLAVVDRDEIVFVDGQGPRTIEISWQDFHPGERSDLRAPVTFTCIYYEAEGRQIMARLQGEFQKALELIGDRQPKGGGATVTPIKKG